MAETSRKVEDGSATKKNLDLFQSTPVEVQSTHTPELVIALCGPIGSRHHVVAKLVDRLLSEQYGYKCQIIRLSGIIEEHKGAAPTTSRFDRIEYLINKGNEMRRDFGRSVLADIAVSKIATQREREKEATESKKFQPLRFCHVIDSIKNEEELEALRLVYRDMLYFIGVFSPLPLRQRALEKEGMELAQVYKLIDRDSGEEIHYGQTVRDTFPRADFFLRIDSDVEKVIEKKLERLVNLILNTEIVTPTSDETAMYVAASAAGNSACLSRQVGAAVTDSNGEIVSVGWNDVPKFGGGLYQFDLRVDAKEDRRCIHRDGGICSNDVEKQSIAQAIAKELIDANLIRTDQLDEATKIIRNSKIKNLIEFSRSVHAEMHAIILGSQLGGDRVRGGRLFCTTYLVTLVHGTLS